MSADDPDLAAKYKRAGRRAMRHAFAAWVAFMACFLVLYLGEGKLPPAVETTVSLTALGALAWGLCSSVFGSRSMGRALRDKVRRMGRWGG